MYFRNIPISQNKLLRCDWILNEMRWKGQLGSLIHYLNNSDNISRDRNDFFMSLLIFST